MVTEHKLVANEGFATYTARVKYQKLVGSLLYAVISRPDIAFAVSKLASFNMNPNNTHQEAAERVLSYLLATKTYALKLGGGDKFEVFSDASFADDVTVRKSSQAYVMRLFGGVIGWRANKQDTVTTSTTEAELLALSQATKEAMYEIRLIRELGVELDEQGGIQVWCDNAQTIRLITADINTLQTKLRHVDIHSHWLREKQQRKEISVEYKATGEMLADGLTKALTEEKFTQFRCLVGVQDVKDLLKERRLKEMDLEPLGDWFGANEGDSSRELKEPRLADGMEIEVQEDQGDGEYGPQAMDVTE